MLENRETFSSGSQEVSHLASEAHKAYTIQEGGPKTPEEATLSAIEKYSRAEPSEF